MSEKAETLSAAIRNTIATIFPPDVGAVDLAHPELLVLSATLLLATGYLAHSRRTSLGPSSGGPFNPATLTLGVFLSTLLLNCALATHREMMPLNMFLAKVFDTMQMLVANLDLAPIARESVGGWHALASFYVLFVFIVAPVTTFFDLLALFTDMLAWRTVWLRSLWRDTYLVTPIGEQTLALAESIREEYGRRGEQDVSGRSRRANVVFTDCADEAGTAMANRASDLGAVCVRRSVERTLDGVCKGHRVCVVFDGGDVSDLARATSLYEHARSRWGTDTERDGSGFFGRMRRLLPRREAVDIEIYLFSPLVSAEEMLPGQTTEGAVRMWRVDWTRSLVESTVREHPLFLLNPSPALARRHTVESGEGQGEPTLDDIGAIELQRHMLKEGARRIAIVGAGHVGTEFLKMAIACSRIPGMRFRFDVIDRVPDDPASSASGSAAGRRCAAEATMRASAPELFDAAVGGEDAGIWSEINFYCYDVRGVAYERFMVEHAPEITYVLIGLGNDALTAEAAVRTRKMLERGILKARGDDYGTACRPVVVAVIDDDGLGDRLRRETSENLSQRIDVVGSRRRMFSLEAMRRPDERTTDGRSEDSRTPHAAGQHAKYQVFAFAREAGRCDRLAVDWRCDFREVPQSEEGNPTSAAIAAYNDFCADENNREWLLRMEHRRWCALARAGGWRSPGPEEVRRYEGVFAEEPAYRSDETGLHAQLVAFERLPQELLEEYEKGLRIEGQRRA